MKTQIAFAEAGLGTMFWPHSASAQWYSEFSPYPRSYAIDSSCGQCYTVDSTTTGAFATAAGTWNNAFSGAGWGSNWMVTGGGDVTIQFRNDYTDFGATGGGCASNGTTGHLVCDPWVKYQDSTFQEQLYLHEFGHMFGLSDDSTAYDTVMSGNPVWTSDFTANDYWGFEYYWG